MSDEMLPDQKSQLVARKVAQAIRPFIYELAKGVERLIASQGLKANPFALWLDLACTGIEVEMPAIVVDLPDIVDLPQSARSCQSRPLPVCRTMPVSASAAAGVKGANSGSITSEEADRRKMEKKYLKKAVRVVAKELRLPRKCRNVVRRLRACFGDAGSGVTLWLQIPCLPPWMARKKDMNPWKVLVRLEDVLQGGASGTANSVPHYRLDPMCTTEESDRQAKRVFEQWKTNGSLAGRIERCLRKWRSYPFLERIGMDIIARDLQQQPSLLRQATKALKSEQGRVGQLLKLGPTDRLVVLGDVHCDAEHFDEILCWLFEKGLKSELRQGKTHLIMTGDIMDSRLTQANSPQRFIENGPEAVALLLTVASLKASFPNHFHVLAGNGELGFGDKKGSWAYAGCAEAFYGKPGRNMVVKFHRALPMFAVAEVDGRRYYLSHGLNLWTLVDVEFDEKKRVKSPKRKVIASEADLSDFASAAGDDLLRKLSCFNETSFAKIARHTDKVKVSKDLAACLKGIKAHMAIAGHIHAFDTTEVNEFADLNLTSPDPWAFATYEDRVLVLNSFGSKGAVFLDIDAKGIKVRSAEKGYAGRDLGYIVKEMTP